MTTFLEDFQGGYISDGVQISCQIYNEASCPTPTDCASLKSGIETGFRNYTTEAYYIWIGMANWSKMMNLVWQALEWAAPDMNTLATGVGEAFEVIVPGQTEWSKIFPVSSAVTTMLAVLFIAYDAAPGTGPIGVRSSQRLEPNCKKANWACLVYCSCFDRTSHCVYIVC